MRKLLLAVALLFAPLLRADVIPLDHFIKHGDYLDVKISPDGKHLLARARSKDRVALIFLDSATGKLVGGVPPGRDNIIHSARWVNNNRAVYEFAEKQHFSDAPIATGELFATNVDGTQKEFLYGYRAGDEQTGSRISTKEDTKASLEILSTLPDDDKHILIIEYPWSTEGNYFYDDRKKRPIISRLNVYTGRKKKLEVLPHGRSYALATQGGDIHFIGWTDKQNVSHTAYRENQDAPWQPLDVAFNTSSRTLPQSLNHDGSKVYLAGRIGDKRLYSLFELDLNTGERTTVFEGHNTDIESWKRDIETGEPVVGYSYPGHHAYHYASGASKTAKLHKMLAKAFDDNEVHITSSSKDGTEHLVHVSSSVNPGEYYIFNSETKAAQFIWANRSWIDPRQMRTKDPFTIAARDGTELNGYLTLPAGAAQHKPPMVVMIHGGPRARDFSDFDTEVQLLANRGYAVLQVNFRGSDGYGLDFMFKGNRQWGNAMINDIIDATQWAVDQGKVDPDKLCVYGASYGGYAALMSAIKAPDMYKCTVGYVGIYDLAYMFSESDIPGNWGGKAYLQEVLGDNADELRAYSPVHNVDKIKAPVMLIHGERDRRVPVINAEVMEKALKKAGKEVRTLNYALSGHGVYDVNSRRELYQGLIDFLNEHIRPPS